MTGLAMFESIQDLFGDHSGWLRILGIGLTLSAISLIALHVWRKDTDIQRRIRSDSREEKVTSGLAGSLRQKGEDVLAVLSGQDASAEPDQNTRLIRRKLVQAGFAGSRSVAIFFGTRVAAALTAAILAFVLATSLVDTSGLAFKSGAALTAAILGYMAPSFLLERRLNRCRSEHRAGFPDFMDLMVVCAQAGLSMEAGMQRIAMEMRRSHASLTFHIDLALLEIRSGRPMTKAIEAMSLRLDIPEARSFATLLQQTEELGSSLTQSLRAYSDDMRNKRMMQAEEKAYALPAKLVVPLTLFVFPVLMVVLMLPVVISVSRSSL